MEGHDANPYAPPEADLAKPLSDAETMRKAHINHEASFQSIGTLYFLWALAFIVAGGLAASATVAAATALRGGGTGFAGALVLFALAGGFITTGIAVRRLRSWARWVSLVVALGFAGLITLEMVKDGHPSGALGLLFPLIVIYLVLHPKSGTVCSADYRAIIAQTPHIKYKRSLLTTVAVAILVILIVSAIAASIA